MNVMHFFSENCYLRMTKKVMQNYVVAAFILNNNTLYLAKRYIILGYLTLLDQYHVRTLQFTRSL